MASDTARLAAVGSVTVAVRRASAAAEGAAAVETGGAAVVATQGAAVSATRAAAGSAAAAPGGESAGSQEEISARRSRRFRRQSFPNWSRTT